jgi:hypothetical protein
MVVNTTALRWQYKHMNENDDDTQMASEHRRRAESVEFLASVMKQHGAAGETLLQLSDRLEAEQPDVALRVRAIMSDLIQSVVAETWGPDASIPPDPRGLTNTELVEQLALSDLPEELNVEVALRLGVRGVMGIRPEALPSVGTGAQAARLRRFMALWEAQPEAGQEPR